MFGKLNNCSFPALTLLLILLTIFPYACSKPREAPQRAMYHWRSNFDPSGFETTFLKRHAVTCIYIKYFDVDLVSGTPIPIASLSASANNLVGYEVIPVVFITQAALQAMADSSIATYAQKISNRIREMNRSLQLNAVKEWQIDCDWTAGTREKYFTLLREIRRHSKESGAQLSVTLRLYPFKYRSKMGTPPADRAMLMCYNMGNLKDPNTRNSILDANEMKKYLSVERTYPLPLDVALPLFSWYVWFRQGEYRGLVYPSDIAGASVLERSGNRLVFSRDTVINGRNFLRGDQLREETSSFDALKEVRKLIDGALEKQPPRRIALFHLDSVILSKYPPDAFEDIFGGAR